MKYIFILTIACFLGCTSNEEQKVEDNNELQLIEKKHLIVDAESFKSLITDKKDIQLIDVRTPDEFNMGTIASARNLNILDGTFEINLIHLNKQEPIYVFCAKGGRSAKAAKLLQNEGFSYVVDLDGGYTAFIELQNDK